MNWVKSWIRSESSPRSMADPLRRGSYQVGKIYRPSACRQLETSFQSGMFIPASLKIVSEEKIVRLNQENSLTSCFPSPSTFKTFQKWAQAAGLPSARLEAPLSNFAPCSDRLQSEDRHISSAQRAKTGTVGRSGPTWQARCAHCKNIIVQHTCTGWLLKCWSLTQ